MTVRSPQPCQPTLRPGYRQRSADASKLPEAFQRLARTPRAALNVLYTLHFAEAHFPGGATYRALGAALGIRSRSAIASAVRAAAAAGFVRVIPPAGHNGMAVIRLTEEAVQLFTEMVKRKGQAK